MGIRHHGVGKQALWSGARPVCPLRSGAGGARCAMPLSHDVSDLIDTSVDMLAPLQEEEPLRDKFTRRLDHRAKIAVSVLEGDALQAEIAGLREEVLLHDCCLFSKLSSLSLAGADHSVDEGGHQRDEDGQKVCTVNAMSISPLLGDIAPELGEAHREGPDPCD